MRLTPLDLLVVAAYMASLSAMGIYFGRRQDTSEEYLLGSRRIHWLLAAGSIVATLVSTLTYLAVPGEMIRYGLGYFTGLLGLPLAIPVVTRLILPRLMRMQLTSVYAYLEHRYHPAMRTLAAAIFTLRTLLWMGLIIYSCSLAVVEVSAWDLYWTIAVTGLLTTFYSSAGGLRTVIWTDNLQLAVLIGGALAIPICIAMRTGSGPSHWWQLFAAAGHTHIEVFSLDPTVRLTMLGVIASQFAWSICAQGSDQVAIQRYLATPSLEAAKRTAWVYLGINLALVGLLAFCGLALFAFYSAHGAQVTHDRLLAEADRLMPQFIVEQLPPGVSGLLLAALLAAAMSSLSSGINSVAAVVANDLLRRRPELGNSLRAAKAISVIAGLGSIALALVTAWAVERTSWNLIDLSQRINHIFVGPLAVLFFAGMLFPAVGSRAALGGFLAATAWSLVVAFGAEWMGLERPISFTWLVPGSLAAGLCGVGVGKFLLQICRRCDKLEKTP